ncbi:MAG: hypothetical protein DDT42_00987 [candidate division WS2 bacterium]|uniref:IS110 family transposase n=1 Tax=Psychracetigena formicireducens TaxID=2986056 RepID=A0A9E2BHR8_PSYF1|nr:hypothetical protein [Candidatus Psychracetigena formicireducens]
MKYIGIDLHKQYLISTMMDIEGNILRKDRVATDRLSVRRYFQSLGPPGELKAVLEAGFNWTYLYDELTSLVGEVKLAHPLKTRLIAEARIKTDSLDSEALAHLLRTDFLVLAYAPDSQAREKKNLLRYRASLIQLRVSLKNKIHAILNRNHIEDPLFNRQSDKFGKTGKSLLRSFTLKGIDTRMVNNYLDLIEGLENKLKEVDKEIKEIVLTDEICQLLSTIPGIGNLLSLLLRYEIDDIARFPSAKKLCSYAGLVPSTHSTGGKTFQGRITKNGNKWLRWGMTEAAQQAFIYDAGLASFYYRIKRREGSKRARVALARKLLEIVYCVWKERRPYYQKPVAVAL